MRGPSCVMKLYCVYIDEFGHVGPFVSRDHPRYNTSPIFGLGGILVPSEEVRNLGEFFLAHKARFLGQEMRAHGVTDPLTWEKKGSALYTAQNYTKYRRPLTDGTRRLLNRLRDFGGRTLYLGQKKTPVVDAFDPKALSKHLGTAAPEAGRICGQRGSTAPSRDG